LRWRWERSLYLNVGADGREAKSTIGAKTPEIAEDPQFYVVDVRIVEGVWIGRGEDCYITVNTRAEDLAAVTTKEIERDACTMRISVNVCNCLSCRVAEELVEFFG
jgi:hypothetical protein